MIIEEPEVSSKITPTKASEDFSGTCNPVNYQNWSGQNTILDFQVGSVPNYTQKPQSNTNKESHQIGLPALNVR